MPSDEPVALSVRREFGDEPDDVAVVEVAAWIWAWAADCALPARRGVSAVRQERVGRPFTPAGSPLSASTSYSCCRMR